MSNWGGTVLGCRSVSQMSWRAASIVSSVVVMGMAVFVGNHVIVSAMHMALVLGIHTW